jgi:hypothetical protein
MADIDRWTPFGSAPTSGIVGAGLRYRRKPRRQE